jgi:probable DNA repair protein
MPLILTPNQRLSATLHKLHHQQQLSQHHTTWLTPNILPITTWISQLWKDYTHKTFADCPLLLTQAQEQYLWEKIILSTKDHEQLLQISETADLARAAWSLLMQWQVDINHPLFESSEDYIALQHWVRAFQSRSQKNNWVDAALLPNKIMEKISAGEIIPPATIMTYGFTEYAPQLKQLFAACERVGSVISKLEISNDEGSSLRGLSLRALSSEAITGRSNPDTNEHWIASSQKTLLATTDLHTHTVQGDCKRISLQDKEREIQTMARWAQALHEQQPLARIGCVIPSLDKIRDRVLQLFSEVFAADDTYTVDLQRAAFNLSAGKSLAQCPVVNTALQILSLRKKNLGVEALSYLLASPFVGEAEGERIRRAQFDHQLRKNNSNLINLDTLTNENSKLHKSCQKLAKRLIKLMPMLEDAEVKTHTAWAQTFTDMLSVMGWPGERSLNSEEYQMVESWLNLLTEFVTLDQIASAVNFQQALHTLKKMAANKIFQAKSPDAPIQVLGMLEAAGMPFDYLWVAGLDDISWPPQPKPNPFIPKKLQRDLGMPHATAERELSFCNIITKQFQQSAPEVIFSHAEKLDELELQASPLIRDISGISFNDLHLKKYLNPAEKIFHHRDVEWIVDDKAPPVSPDEKIGGGVSIIKLQSLCPFRSFAEWRLHAHAVEKPLPGLRAKDRGQVIHKALELIWNRLQDQQTLLAMDEVLLEDLITECIETALSVIPSSHAESTQYLALEKKRLFTLIHDWLQIEKQRPPFKVMMNEKTVSFSLGELALTMRVDRIDQLEDGSKFILDYKTGKNNDANHWFGARPEEPQLPLYALLDAENTSGISFAQIHTGEHCFKGISQYEMEMKGVREISDIKNAALSWVEQIAEWREIFTKLSADFYQGAAKVDPKDPPQTCEWCALKPLCRINELS